MCCGILLVLHVDINSRICYTMVINLVLFFSCSRWQKEGRQGEEEGGGSLGKLFDIFFCVVCVSD